MRTAGPPANYKKCEKLNHKNKDDSKEENIEKFVIIRICKKPVLNKADSR